MTRTSACVLASTVLLTAGAVHGMWTGRWGAGAERLAAADLLRTVPLTIDAWSGEDHEMSEREREVAGIDGYLLRRYTHRSTGEAVSVLLVCGRPGPVSVHTPDICYSGAGYGLVAEPARTDITIAGKAEPAPFFTALFRKDAATADPLRIFWSWNRGSGWSAPDRPRWTFARARVLYKLYIVNRAPAPGQSADEDVAVRFLRVLLPQLQNHLFGQS